MWNKNRRVKKLEKRRKEVLGDIRKERLAFEVMGQRARQAGDTPDETFLNEVLERLAEIEMRATQEADIDELGALSDDADQQGQLRAYICPRVEIYDEGTLAIDLLEEWSVPEKIIASLRSALGKKVQQAATDLESARSALRALFEERDSWDKYSNEYEDLMKKYTLRLFWVAIALLLLAIFFLYCPLTVLVGLLFAGAAGSCISVMSKMPLREMARSGELDAFGRKIWGRIGLGIGASMIGSALLAWSFLPISIQNQTFADLLSACAARPTTLCTGLKILIVLGVSMLFGFGERALRSFERTVFSSPGED